MATTGSQIYKNVRWVVVIALVVVVLLMLKRPQPAAAPLATTEVAEKATEFNAKLEGLKSAQEHGRGGTQASFTADEVNPFIADSTVREAREAANRSEHPAAAAPT